MLGQTFPYLTLNVDPHLNLARIASVGWAEVHAAGVSAASAGDATSSGRDVIYKRGEGLTVSRGEGMTVALSSPSKATRGSMHNSRAGAAAAAGGGALAAVFSNNAVADPAVMDLVSEPPSFEHNARWLSHALPGHDETLWRFLTNTLTLTLTPR